MRALFSKDDTVKYAKSFSPEVMIAIGATVPNNS